MSRDLTRFLYLFFLWVALAFTFIFARPAQATTTWLGQAIATDGNREQEREAEVQRARQLGDEVATHLLTYRRQVEKEAYATTMDLCLFYRRAVRGMADPHSGMSKNKKALVDAKMPTDIDGAKAWSKIFFEGTKPAFATVAGFGMGLKADYIEKQNLSPINFSGQIPFVNFAGDYWFRSLYVMYLIESSGFLQGATHCLNTLDHNEIMNFASAIIAADLSATWVTYMTAIPVTILTGDQILALILNSTRGLWIKPVQLLTHLMRVHKTKLIVVGSIVIPIGAAQLFEHIKNIEDGKHLVSEMLRPGSAVAAEGERRIRLLLLNRAYELYTQITEIHAMGGDSREAEQKFKNFLARNFAVDKISNYEYDRLSLQGQPSLGETDQVYYDLLSFILPIAKGP